VNPKNINVNDKIVLLSESAFKNLIEIIINGKVSRYIGLSIQKAKI